jgi:hypothetical protein
MKTSSHYSVLRALQDFSRAVQANPLAIIVTSVCSFGLLSVVVVWASQSLGTLKAPEAGKTFNPGTELTSLVVTLLIGCVLTALSLCIAGGGFSDGYDRKRRSLTATLRQSWPHVVRVCGATLLYNLLIIAPFIISLLLLIVPGLLQGGGPFVAVAPLLMLGSGLWAIIAGVRFALVPYIVRFEPSIPVTQAFSRSNQLLQDSDYWLLAGVYLLIGLVYVGLLLLSGYSFTAPTVASAWRTVPVSVVVSILSTGLMVMIYRNRAAAAAQRPDQD